MRGRKAVLTLFAATLVATLGACAPTSSTSPEQEGAGEEAGGSASTDKTMQEWGELFPLEYSSYKQQYVHEDGSIHGHYWLQNRFFAPVERDGTTLLADETGAYGITGMTYDDVSHQWIIDDGQLRDSILEGSQLKCYSCKSSKFNDAFDEYGFDAFAAGNLTEEEADLLNGQIWDCGTCHEETPGESPADSQLVLFEILAKDTYNKFEASERVCGQCHNSADSTYYVEQITDEESMNSISAFEYGLDFESIYEAAIDQGAYKVDEETGIKLTSLDHPDIEFVQGSSMRELGVTCTDCHMPQMSDEASGTTYTSHNASSSPLENDEALEYCLSCHKNQGINDAEEMVAMVEDLQAETAEVQIELRNRLADAYNTIKDAVQNGGVDEAKLENAKELYSRTEAILTAVVGTASPGVKVVHNPMAAEKYAMRADELLDQLFAELQQ